MAAQAGGTGRLTGGWAGVRLTACVVGAGMVLDSGSKPVTEMLARWKAGDQSALESLLPLVYDELRSLARHYLADERYAHTLQATALVHEAFLRLVDQSPSNMESRAQFFGIAARLMRQILVDHARSRQASKRGSGILISLDPSADIAPQKDLNLVALDDALNELARLDERQARIVELRFFTGLSIEETARVLAISPVTVTRSWRNARLWLQRELSRGAQE